MTNPLITNQFALIQKPLVTHHYCTSGVCYVIRGGIDGGYYEGETRTSKLGEGERISGNMENTTGMWKGEGKANYIRKAMRGSRRRKETGRTRRRKA